MRTRPSVSVVIPTFEYGHFVGGAIESVLAQTFPAAEIIVVDDGSMDDTRARVEQYGNRVRYVWQENRGLSAARNTGIRQSRGDWIAFLDSDDLWHRQKLEVEFGAVASLEGVVFFGSHRSTDLSAPLPASAQARRLSVEDFLCWMPLSGSSAVVARECFDVVGGFDEELRSVEDRDMWLRLVSRFPSAAVETGGWYYREHSGQMNRNAIRMHDNYVRVLTRFFRDRPQSSAVERLGWAYLYFDSAYSHFTEGQARAAVAFLIRSIWLHPTAMSKERHLRVLRLKLLTRLILGERLWARLR